jgi:hypothetical protein
MIACALLWQDHTNYIHSRGDLRREAERYRSLHGDSPPLSLYLDPEDEAEGSGSASSARLERSPGSDRDSNPPEVVPEHIMETIAALESQVDHLCSLLDTFRSEFDEHLDVFRRMIETLPEHVGVDYNPRQRAQLLRMYGERVSGSSQLAMQTLQRDLSRLTSLDGVSPYASLHPSLQPSPSSSGNNLQYLFVPPHEEPTVPSGIESLRPGPSLQRRIYTRADSIPDSLPDDNSEPDLDYGEPQHPLAEVQDEESAGLQQGVVFDRTRIHEDGRGEDLENCELCVGWRRTMGPPRW